jgi:hypothetical protein
METQNEMLSCPKCKSQNVSSKNGQFHCLDCGCQWQLTNDATATGKKLTIRNSTTEFLIFQTQSQANGVEVFYQNETLWLTQKAIAMLFDVDKTAITKYLKNIFGSGELLQDSVCANFAHTAEDGKTYISCYRTMGRLLRNKPRNSPNRNLRNTESYRTICLCRISTRQ